MSLYEKITSLTKEQQESIVLVSNEQDLLVTIEQMGIELSNEEKEEIHRISTSSFFDAKRWEKEE